MKESISRNPQDYRPATRTDLIDGVELVLVDTEVNSDPLNHEWTAPDQVIILDANEVEFSYYMKDDSAKKVYRAFTWWVDQPGQGRAAYFLKK